jgi:hypothetical protein
MIAIFDAFNEIESAQNPYRWPKEEEGLWCHSVPTIANAVPTGQWLS